MSLVSGNQTKSFKYVYELPYAERKLLCNILDINDQWERLGGEMMGFSIIELHEFKRAEKSGESPTDRLLQCWGCKNNTILDLYQLLYSMEHFQATNVLLPFIPPEFNYKNMEAQVYDNIPQVMDQAAFVPSNHAPPPALEPNPHLLRDLRPQKSDLPSPHKQSTRETLARSQSTPMADRNVGRPVTSSVKIPVQKSFQQSVGDQPQVTSGVDSRATSTVERSEVPTVKILNTAIPPGRNQEKKASYSLENNLEALQRPPEKFTTKQCTPKACTSKREKPSDYSEPSRYISENGSGEEKERNNPVPPQRNRHQSNSSNASVLSECSVTMISFKELEYASNHWNKSHILGSGGFGEVYRGRWINQNVAIKKIKPKNRNDRVSFSASITQIIDELRYLQKYRHDNILQVYGFSADTGKPHCLVYQFMANGSLEYRLLCKKVEAFSDTAPDPLNWRQRFNIARGTAAALQFLHTVDEKPLIHGDVKSANILLDSYLEPKLGDFGLAREGPLNNLTSMKVSRVQGTPHYVPPEYLKSHKLSTKVDTYSFGIVLFEICSGRRAYNSSNKRYLKDEAFNTKDKYSLKDSKAGFENKVFDILFDIGLACADDNPKDRPDMTTVFQDLENSKKIIQEEWNRRFSGEYHRYIGSQQNPSINSFPSTSPTSCLRPNLVYRPDRNNLTPIPQHFSPPQSIHPFNPSWNRPSFMIGGRPYPYPVPINEGYPPPFIPRFYVGGTEQPRKCSPNIPETTNGNISPIPKFIQPLISKVKGTAQNNDSSSAQDVESSHHDVPHKNVAPIPRFSQLMIKPGKSPGENNDSSSTQDMESSHHNVPHKNVAPIPRFSQLMMKPGKSPGENNDSSSTQDMESSYLDGPTKHVAPIPRFSQLMIKPGKSPGENNDSSFSQNIEASNQEVPHRNVAPIPRFSQLMMKPGKSISENNTSSTQDISFFHQEVPHGNVAHIPRFSQLMIQTGKSTSENNDSSSQTSESSSEKISCENNAPIPRFSQLMINAENNTNNSLSQASHSEGVPRGKNAPIPELSPPFINPGKDTATGNNNPSQTRESSRQGAKYGNAVPISQSSKFMINPKKDTLENDNSPSKFSESSSDNSPSSFSFSSSEVSGRQVQATSVVPEERIDSPGSRKQREKRTNVVSAQGKKFSLF